MIEKIAQFLTDLTGSPVSESAAGGAVVVLIGSLILGLIAMAWFKAGIEDEKRVNAEWERFEEEWH